MQSKKTVQWVLWGALLLGEPLSWDYLPGCVLIGVALWLVVRQTAPIASRRNA